jgi:lysophospholipase L1-like esterase
MTNTMRTLMICAFALLFGSCSGERETASRTERIIFFGDSITEQGAAPAGYVTLARDSLAKSSGGAIQVIGAGISGNRVPDLLARVDRDVIAKRPSLTIIYIGINDVWHWALFNRGTPKSEYEAGLKDLITRIRKAGSQVILCTPSVIGEKRAGTNPSDAMLAEYAGTSRSVARAMGVQICDLNAAFGEYLRAHNPQDLEKGILTVDGVHLSAEGNRFVAEQMLAAIAAYRTAPPATEVNK